MCYKVNEYLRDNITSSFDIDDYIGDPNLIYEDQYTDLMVAGGVILKTDSPSNYKLWYFDMLEPLNESKTNINTADHIRIDSKFERHPE